MPVHTARREQHPETCYRRPVRLLRSKEPHKAANNRVDKLKDTEADRLIMEDQAQIEEEDQVGDRPRAAAAPSQLTLSDISGQAREAIARTREEAIQKKKAREEGGQVEREIRTQEAEK